MAELENLTIENKASNRSTMDPNVETSLNSLEGSKEGMRVAGGDCECTQPPANYPRNPLVVRSGELPPQNECVPSCPYGRNYSPNRGQQQSSYETCPAQQYRSQSRSQDCGCSSRRARRTASSHYMDYKEFQHSPKTNPVYEPTDYSKYPPEPRQRRQSESSCGCRSPPRRQSESVERSCPPEEPRQRRQPESSCGYRSPPRSQSAERICSPEEPRQRIQSECSCDCETQPRIQSVERHCPPQEPRKRRQSEGSYGSPGRRKSRSRQGSSPPDKSHYQGKRTPAAQTPEVRQHAHSHLHGTCPRAAPPAPAKRACPSPPSRKTRPTERSSRGGQSIPCSECYQDEYGQYSDGPSDYEMSRSGTTCQRNPIANDPVRPRSRSPTYRKPHHKEGKPPLCSNETLVEKPVHTYRFSCAENHGSPGQSQKLCPQCHKAQMQKQRSASAAKRHASAAAQKCCAKCGLLPMMPRISMPNVASSNRCIYKTLCRPLSRPNSVFKTKYELTVCCRKRRCQGGKNCHYLVGTVATNIKKRAKFIEPGGHLVPTKTNSKPARLRRRQHRSVAGHCHDQAAPQSPVHKRKSSDYSRIDPTLATSPPPSLAYRRRSPVVDNPSYSGKHRYPDWEQDQMKDQMQDQEQEHQQPRSRSLSAQSEHSNQVAPQSPAPPNTQQIAPTNTQQITPPNPQQIAPPNPQQIAPPNPQQIAPPNPQQTAPPRPTAADSQISHPQLKRTTFMGTELNPFYKGNFLKTHSSREAHLYHMGPIQQRKQELPEPVKVKKGASTLMPPKWTGVGQLQSWVFGDSFIGNPSVQGTNNGTWSWRQIFGRSKKRTQLKSERSQASQ